MSHPHSAIQELPRTSLVRRDRLVSRLVESTDTPVVLIDAPAGFGKSTVLGEWDQPMSGRSPG